LTRQIGGRYTPPASMPETKRPAIAGSDNLWGGYGMGLQVSVYMLSAILVWGGVGYLVDRLAGTGKAFTAVGMVVGAIAGTYLIYLRYGRGDDAQRS
jgi:F0F1-type ATP synthase assembly protein I